jgi:hypothetical protein
VSATRAGIDDNVADRCGIEIKADYQRAVDHVGASRAGGSQSEDNDADMREEPGKHARGG